MTKKSSGLSNVHSNNLLCCPFCGEQPKWWDSIDELKKKFIHVQCQNAFCYARPHICEPPKVAFEAWNHRAT